MANFMYFEKMNGGECFKFLPEWIKEVKDGEKGYSMLRVAEPGREERWVSTLNDFDDINAELAAWRTKSEPLTPAEQAEQASIRG